ncbi:MAG TPA: nucleotide sugar dehydrogenase [Anaerolineae bacterium]|nr:nucleotide sugar dehydrogenase [Anaerolineae bacterium]
MEKIVDHSARVAVIGLGYVGLPLAVGFARAGYPVLGLDVDPAKVASLSQGRSYIQDVASTDVAAVTDSGRLRASSDYRLLREMNVIFICVPTPFDARKAPDLSYIEQAAQGIAAHLQPGQLVILQSTTYPGTTEEFVLPLLEKSGLKAGQDFCLAFSPERINPGDQKHTVENTPKVVGGLTPRCTELARVLLAQLFAHVHVVSSPRAAEMTKLLENIFRSVNIALVNELALLSERMGIDLWEVIEAAKTKPFGFMPFYPGPGVGGHCIPVDPYYLSWKAREYDFYTKFIELAAEVNLAMPYHVVDVVSQALSREGKVLAGSRVLILGVAFKRDVDDARNSPAERIIELLLRRGAEVSYSDPYVPRYHVGDDVFCPEERWLEHVELSDEVLAAADCAVIVAGHRVVDYGRLLQRASLVVDTDNSTSGLDGTARVVRIGAPAAPAPLHPTQDGVAGDARQMQRK